MKLNLYQVKPLQPLRGLLRLSKGRYYIPTRYYSSEKDREESKGSREERNDNGFRKLKTPFLVGIGAGLSYTLLKNNVVMNDSASSIPLGEGAVHADPVTGVKYDEQISFTNEDKKDSYLLKAYGVRAVTFLKFSAYSLALYIHKDDWNIKRKELLDGFDSQKFLSDPDYCENWLDKFIKEDIRFAVKIVPVRPTNGPHLRGGLIRNLKFHLDHQKKTNIISNEEYSKLNNQFNEFGHLFTKGNIPMSAELYFIKIKKGDNSFSLKVVDNGVVKGILDEPWFINTLLRSYLSGRKIVSEDVRKKFIEMIEK